MDTQKTPVSIGLLMCLIINCLLCAFAAHLHIVQRTLKISQF